MIIGAQYFEMSQNFEHQSPSDIMSHRDLKYTATKA
jgi:hypothetical protein